jgi:predicted nucleic-acid-binding protein
VTRKQREALEDALLALDDTVVVLEHIDVRRLGTDGYRITDGQFRDLVKARDLMFQAGIRIEAPAEEVPS